MLATTGRRTAASMVASGDGGQPTTISEEVWRPEDVTASWLTAALERVGALGRGSVAGFAVEPVGTGQMGDSFRFRLEVDPPDAPGPRSIVGKFTAADEQSRTTGVSMRTAEVEVRFYQQIAPTLGASIARCYYAHVEPATARFVLLLEDLDPRTPGDQVAGCDADAAAAALEEVAKIHAARWADPLLAGLEWLNRRDETANAALASVFPFLYQGFVERYADRLGEPVVRVGDPFFPRMADYYRERPGPRTIQHADYRIDNLLFGGPPRSPVAIVDWQTVTWGPGAADVSYFLGGSLTVEDRRRHEEDLLRHYHDVLRSSGVTGYGMEDLRLDYRRHAYAGLSMAVGAAMMVARTDRGDDMFLAMAHRHAAQVEDLGSEALLAD
jgi:aminoglycoside/choline kinase family phosphotransferase